MVFVRGMGFGIELEPFEDRCRSPVDVDLDF